MSRALRGLVLVVLLVWWLPTILVAFAMLVAVHVDLWRLVRRARRLRLAGRLDEAAAVLERARTRIGEGRGGRGA